MNRPIFAPFLCWKIWSHVHQFIAVASPRDTLSLEQIGVAVWWLLQTGCFLGKPSLKTNFEYSCASLVFWGGWAMLIAQWASSCSHSSFSTYFSFQRMMTSPFPPNWLVFAHILGRQHCCLNICSYVELTNTVYTVSEAKIQITPLIVRRGNLSNIRLLFKQFTCQNIFVLIWCSFLLMLSLLLTPLLLSADDDKPLPT